MIEVVFSNSACGSLKTAQHSLGGVAVEEGMPLAGKPEDVYSFPLALSVGEISNGFFKIERFEILSSMYSMFPQGEDVAQELFWQGTKNFCTALNRVEQGEDIRIWYSSHPDEQCGLRWFLSEIGQLSYRGDVWLVEMPAWEVKDNHIVEACNSWGEMEPREWAESLRYQKKAPSVLCKALAQDWKQLQQENAPLRAEVNGKLCSVPETFYDPFIWKEIGEQPEEFREEEVIGQVLGKYQLGICDAWIALRLEAMVHSGILEVADQMPEAGPIYQKVLRKAQA